MRRLGIAFACSFVWIASAEAQTCLGNLPFETAPMRAGANVAFSSETHTFGGGISRGFEKLFVVAGGEFTGISNFGDGGSIKGFFASAGTERQVGSTRKYFVCPMGGLFFLSGPEVFADSALSTLMFNIGGRVGFEAATSGTTRIVPTFGFFFNIARSSFGGDFDFTNTEPFASVQFGVGFLFNEKLALTPSFIIPFGYESVKPTFNAIVTMKIGQ